jgi:exosortase
MASERVNVCRSLDVLSQVGAIRALRLGVIVALLSLGFFWSYWPTLVDIVVRWSTDPRYSHGYLVPVFAGIVLWHRRSSAVGLSLRLSWSGLPFLFLAMLLRMVAGYFYLDWLDALSLLPCLLGTCLLLGGWSGLRWAWPAPAFLVFMLPLPHQVLTALALPLQKLAIVTSTFAMQTLGLPAVADGNSIIIDDFKLGVLEACSGLGMLVTFFSLSTAVALIVQRPWPQRLTIFLSAIPIGILANLLRITATGVLAETAGRKIAFALYHDFAGWLMMPLALFLLWIELRFLERLFIVPSPDPVPLACLRPSISPYPLPPARQGFSRTRASLVARIRRTVHGS